MNRAFNFLIMLLCLSCATGTSRIIEKEKLNFSYTDDAYLFFRNMRQAQYDRKVMEKEGLRLYVHEDFSPSQLLKTTLVVNWKMNKAYVLVNLTDSTLEKYDIKVYYKEEDGTITEILQENLRRQGELSFLTEIYNQILTEHSLFIQYKGQEEQPLFNSSDDLEAFRVSMYDFYRLTAVL